MKETDDGMIEDDELDITQTDGGFISTRPTLKV